MTITKSLETITDKDANAVFLDEVNKGLKRNMVLTSIAIPPAYFAICGHPGKPKNLTLENPSFDVAGGIMWGTMAIVAGFVALRHSHNLLQKVYMYITDKENYVLTFYNRRLVE